MRIHKYRPEIDGLRAVAVLPVLLFHVGWPGFSGGFVGVDVFFVISGYLITKLIVDEFEATGGFRFGEFYLRRMRRLFPALAVVMATTALATLFILSPGHLRIFGQELIVAALSISNVYYFSESGYFAVGKEFNFLLHTWSLAVEEQFYLLWPVFLLVFLQRGRAALCAILTALALCSLFASQFLPDREAAFFLTPFRAFEFAAGALLVATKPFSPGQSRLAPEIMLIAGLSMIGFSVYAFSAETRLPGFMTLLPVVGAVLCIHAGLPSFSGWLLANPVSVWIGKISYSLYLVHWPLFMLYAYTVPALTDADRVALLCAAFFLAAILHYGVEQPLRHIWSESGSNVTFFKGAAAITAACIALGAATSLGKGWEWRLPPDAAALLASAKRETKVDKCRYATEMPDADFERRFLKCVARDGPAILVVGDSHGGDLFPALAVNSRRPHIASIWQGGCRPSDPEPECPFAAAAEFVARHKDGIAGIVYKQKGSYLLTENRYLPVERQEIELTLDYLSNLKMDGVPLLWVGPHWEPRYDIDKMLEMGSSRDTDYLRHQNTAIDDVGDAIKAAIARRKAPVVYVSVVDILGPLTNDDFVINGEYTYADKDHWSAKGEEVFGARLIAGSPTLRALMGGLHSSR